MFSRLKMVVLIASLAVIAMVGFGDVSQQVRNAVRIAASAVWGS